MGSSDLARAAYDGAPAAVKPAARGKTRTLRTLTRGTRWYHPPPVAKKTRTPAPPRRVQAPQRRDTRPTRNAAAPTKRALAARDRMFWGFVIGGIVVLAVVGIVLGIVLSSGGSSSSSSYTDKVNFAALPNLHSGPPPWDNGDAYLPSRLPLVHLTALPQETLTEHIHQHLDLYVNGKKVALPAFVGFLPDGSALTSIHTHSTDGVIHVESPDNRPYSLGQLFGEWGVWLGPNRVGDYKGKLQWWVNGKKQTGNPAAQRLTSHELISIVLGQVPFNFKPRTSFDWKNSTAGG